MRLVRGKQIADSISSYDQRCEVTILYNDFYIENSLVGNRQFEKLFNAVDLLPLYISNTSGAIVANIPDSLIIRINTTELNEQLNFMMLEKAYARQEIDRYMEIKGRAVRLMELIKKKISPQINLFMEVHAHTHTERKKWFHYLWEFLMLFLAVFCGFLAEYLLEHKIERERGHQYISSFYEDLKTDTSKFTILINSYQEKLLALGERDECFKTISQDKKSDSCLANLFLNSIQFSDLIFTDRTIQQLKNAGGLRLLKKEDADSIMEYDNMLQLHMRRETTGFQNLQNTVRNAIQSLMTIIFI
jgi:hypothetical protein